jgi:hypothetical protein
VRNLPSRLPRTEDIHWASNRCRSPLRQSSTQL